MLQINCLLTILTGLMLVVLHKNLAVAGAFPVKSTLGTCAR